MAIRLELTPAEMLLAATTGVHRNVAAIRRGLPDVAGHSGSGWDLHVEGACGEMAVAKHLGLFWNGSINTFRSGNDVGAWQVRTRSRADYDLVVRPNDKPENIFILVIGIAPVFDIIGWISGSDARRDEWKQTYGGRPEAWFVPQKNMNPMNTLPMPKP